MTLSLNTIIQGHVLEVLQDMPDESIHCIVTSPPYWGLRDYGLEAQIWDAEPGCTHEWKSERTRRQSGGWQGGAESGLEGGEPAGQVAFDYKDRASYSDFCLHCSAWRGSLGLEPTPDLYVKHIVDIFRELRRVLRKDGTCWLNMGDLYASGKGSAFNPGGGENSLEGHAKLKAAKAYILKRTNISDLKGMGLKPKDLCMIPSRVALALQADGWWVRSEIIWAKPNPMPESCTDRPTTAHEKVFLLTKAAKYYYDNEAVKEPVAESTIGRGPVDFGGEKGRNYNPEKGDPNYRGGNEQWGRTYDYTEASKTGRNLRSVWTIPTQPFPEAHFATFPEKLIEPCIKAGCPEGGVVLDPFFGSGTVGVVAHRFGCNFIGIELSQEYIEIANRRLEPVLAQGKLI